jgi:hypothetical protein
MLNKLSIIAAILFAVFAVTHFSYPSGTWRYRMTLSVETPEGIKTGSSVYQIGVSTGMKFGDSSGAQMHARGEALMVDLGARGILFVLLTKGADADYSGYLVFKAFPYPGSKQGPLSGVATPEGLKYYVNLRGKVELTPSQLPSLVHFHEINDPKTVEIVDPNDLAKSFGAGVRLTSASIEMVNTGIWPLNQIGISGISVTRGIEKKLGWVGDYTAETSAWKKLNNSGVPVPSGTPNLMFKQGR